MLLCLIRSRDESGMCCPLRSWSFAKTGPHGNLGHKADQPIFGQALSSTLRIFVHLLETSAQKIAASAMMQTACSTRAAVRPRGPNGTHRCFHSDQ